jgi:hypothetical protein
MKNRERLPLVSDLKVAPYFDKIVLALDGMLAWTTEPSEANCEFLKIGKRLFHCYHKDRFGYLLRMAGCDHDARFCWADIQHPSSTLDYLAWTNTDVGRALEHDGSDLILPEHVIAGDGAFVENMTMATPIIPGMQITEVEDAYNFYLCCSCSNRRATLMRGAPCGIGGFLIIGGHDKNALHLYQMY